MTQVTQHRRPLRLAALDDVFDPEALAGITGPVRAVARSPLGTVGYTAARHERLDLTLRTGERRRLVVKQVRLSTDWTACRTSDRLGREAALLGEAALDAVWEAIACPYLAFAAVGGEAALVMEDLSPFLLPDERAPLREEQEEYLLTSLAAMHARFWSSPALGLPWLARAEQYAGLLDAPSAGSDDALATLPSAMRDRVRRGWAAARERLPAASVRLLACSAAESAQAWAGLPRTLLHGDAKVANFALLPERRVAAFDWALLGAGPATLDVGWYLAVNATRLARAKDAVLARYRALLTAGLGAALPDALWDSLARAGTVCGARMLLWSKALALEAGVPGAREEWSWWVDRLQAAARD